jgi:1-acyl-sn-glycerol-3-phosphate acyltransferase
VQRQGAFILASTHLSPFDVPGLIGVSRWRRLDFISITEMLRNPFVAWLFRTMNCEFVDRSRPDPVTSRAVLRRLERGRVVAMFPEGNIRTEETSVIRGGRFKPGVVHLAQLAGVPIVPCVMLGTKAFYKLSAWLPLMRMPLYVNFGAPIEVPREPDAGAARAQASEQLRQAYLGLYQELQRTYGLSEPAFKIETSLPQTPAPH